MVMEWNKNLGSILNFQRIIVLLRTRCVPNGVLVVTCDEVAQTSLSTC